MNVLYTVNPSRRSRRRKAKSGHRKHRSAAQRAATARLVAANRARRGGHHRRAFASNPSPKRRRRSARRHVSAAHRHMRRGFAAVRSSGIVPMLKSGVVGGAGGVVVDVAMGFAAKVLPSTFVTPTNADGTANYMYLGTKVALALGLGTMGRRLPVIGRYAGQMAEGALTIAAYRLMAPLAAQYLTLGAYFNPSPTMRPAHMGKSPALRGVGAYASRREAPTPLVHSPDS